MTICGLEGLSKKLSTVAVLTAALLMSVDTRADIYCRSDFNLPAQPLAQSLTQLGERCHVSLVFASQSLEGIQAQPISGSLVVTDALAQLLSGHNLEFQTISHQAIAVLVAEPNLAKAVDEPIKLEEVQVLGRARTGSHFHYRKLDHSQALVTMSPPKSAFSGSFSLADSLQDLPQVAGNASNTRVGNGGNGSSTLTLRGLPAYYTLVLLDGVRVASSGLVDTAVDLNTLPTANLQAIEILGNGASSIYGADAVAGTVNLVSDDSFDGVSVYQNLGQSGQGDLFQTQTLIQAGTETQNWALSGSFSHYRQDGLMSQERDISADKRDIGGVDLRSSAGPSPWLDFVTGDGQVITVTPKENTDGQQYEDFRAPTQADLFDYADYTSSVSPHHQSALTLAAKYNITDSWQLTARVGASETQTETVHAPTPLFASADYPGWNIAPDQLYNFVGASPVEVRRRTMELGSRVQDNSTDSQWLQLKASHLGPTAHSWRQDFTLYGSRSNGWEEISNLVSGVNLQRGLSEDCHTQSDCVPVNMFGPAGSIDAQQVNFLRANSAMSGSNQIAGLDWQTQGRITDLDTGPLALALGLSARQERDQLSSHTADFVIGAEAQPQLDAKREVVEAFMEWDVPLITRLEGARSLDLQLAARHAWYSDFGHNTSPSVGLSYRATPSWLLRASWAQGYRAPSLDALYRSGYYTQSRFIDPCSNPNNVGVFADCQMQSDPWRTQFLTELGGNPDLQPETSEHWSLGFEFSPDWLDGLLLTGNYYRLDIDDVIHSLGAEIRADGRQSGPSANFIRDDMGNISLIETWYVNGGQRRVESIDWSLDWRFLRDWQLRVQATHMLEYFERIEYADPADQVGSFVASGEGGNGALPEWQGRMDLRWQSLWGLELGYRLDYTGAMVEQLPFRGEERGVDRWITHNLYVDYHFNQSRWRLRLGVDNFTDQAPPLVASSYNDGIDAASHNLAGRYFFGSIGYSFE